MGMKTSDCLCWPRLLPGTRRFAKLTLDLILWAGQSFILMINSLNHLLDCRKSQIYLFMTFHSSAHTDSCFYTAFILDFKLLFFDRLQYQNTSCSLPSPMKPNVELERGFYCFLKQPSLLPSFLW